MSSLISDLDVFVGVHLPNVRPGKRNDCSLRQIAEILETYPRMALKPWKQERMFPN